MTEPRRYKLLPVRNSIDKKTTIVILTLGSRASTKDYGAKKAKLLKGLAKTRLNALVTMATAQKLTKLVLHYSIKNTQFRRKKIHKS